MLDERHHSEMVSFQLALWVSRLRGEDCHVIHSELPYAKQVYLQMGKAMRKCWASKVQLSELPYPLAFAQQHRLV